MRAGRTGDQRAYARLLGELAGVLRALLRRKVPGLPMADVEDLTQEVLLSIHARRDSWDETRPLMPWVRAIAEHKLIDRFRQRQRAGKVFANNLSADDLAEIVPQPEPDLDRGGLDVVRHLAQLSDKQRAVVKGIALDGLSISNVAASLNMSEGAVRVMLHRGLKALSLRAKAGNRDHG